MMKKLSALLLLFSITAQAGLPPTTIKGQSDASSVTTFNLQVPGSGITRLGGPNALIETGYKNYIQDPGAENPNGPTVWAAYANTAQATPVTGTGGAPAVTWTRTTSSPLRGTGSFLFTKDAVNRQGQGASYAFSIDSADQAKVLNVSFDYAVASGTYADADLTVYLYDVTNSAVIQPAGYKILSAAANLPVKQVNTTFQTASNSTSYRLIFHVASTSASAYTVKFDNITVGPQTLTQGTPVTDFTAYPLSVTGFGSASGLTAYSRRVGDSLEVFGQFLSGTTTHVLAEIALPPGLVTRTGIGGNHPIGKAGRDNTANAVHDFSVLPNPGGTTVYMTLADQTGANALSPLYADNMVASGDTVGFSFMVPIQGWSSQVQMSSDTDTRVVSAILGLTANFSPAGNAPIKYDTVVKDTHGAYSTSTGLYTAPVSGYYDISATFYSSSGTANYVLYVNGAAIKYFSPGGTINTVFSGATSYYLNAGDTLSLRPDGPVTLTGQAIFLNHATISRRSGPSQIAASETVAAKYATAGAFSATSGQPINLATKSFDSHNAVTTGAAWKFTAPVSGTYQVAATSIMATTTQTVQVYKNGSLDTTLNSPDNTHWSSGSTLVQMVAGDYIDIRVDATQNITAFVTIQRIGN